jgi:hypothetical protein
VFIQQRAVQTFDDAVRLRPAHLGRTVLDLFELQEEFVRVLVRPAAELASIARREEALLLGYGHLRSRHFAERVAITGSQVSTVVLLNHTAEETGYDCYPFYAPT